MEKFSDLPVREGDAQTPPQRARDDDWGRLIAASEFVREVRHGLTTSGLPDQTGSSWPQQQ